MCLKNLGFVRIFINYAYLYDNDTAKIWIAGVRYFSAFFCENCSAFLKHVVGNEYRTMWAVYLI